MGLFGNSADKKFNKWTKQLERAGGRPTKFWQCTKCGKGHLQDHCPPSHGCTYGGEHKWVAK